MNRRSFFSWLGAAIATLFWQPKPKPTFAGRTWEVNIRQILTENPIKHEFCSIDHAINMRTAFMPADTVAWQAEDTTLVSPRMAAIIKASRQCGKVTYTRITSPRIKQG